MRKLFAWIIEHIITKIHFPYERELSVEELHFFRMENLRGCVLLTHTPYQLSNWGIKGKYSHCEIIVNDDYIAGATTSGVDLHLISSLLKKSNSWAVLMPRDVDVMNRGLVVVEAVAQTEKSIDYDYEFKPDNKKFYCSEFVMYVYKKAVGSIIDYGKLIHPQELFDDKKSWITIKEYEV